MFPKRRQCSSTRPCDPEWLYIWLLQIYSGRTTGNFVGRLKEQKPGRTYFGERITRDSRMVCKFGQTRYSETTRNTFDVGRCLKLVPSKLFNHSKACTSFPALLLLESNCRVVREKFSAVYRSIDVYRGNSEATHRGLFVPCTGERASNIVRRITDKIVINPLSVGFYFHASIESTFPYFPRFCLN